jgi:hypothetical protein
LIKRPIIINLNKNESDLYKAILDYNRNGSNWSIISLKIEKLFTSLIQRKAIPEIRLSIFNNPEYAESGKKSIQQVFVSKGISVNDIVHHPHFIKYIQYFIEGPKLPAQIINEFLSISNENLFDVEPELSEEIFKFVRKCIRTEGLIKHYTATEFYRLALELNYSINDSKAIRKAVMSVN